MTPGLIVVLAVLVLGTGIGLWRRRTDGRFRSDPPAPGVAVSQADLGGAVPEPAADGTLPIVGVRPVEAGPGPEVLDADLLAALGVGPARATLLQFSSAFCSPCRALRRVSSEVAAMVTGVQHVEVDAESHLEAVRALGIWRTPTLLVLDAEGRVVKRATGVPGKPQLIAVLGEVLPG
jgi:thiol-disulfide isomerase/thioredoxin